MKDTTKQALAKVKDVLKTSEAFRHAALVVDFDRMTVCPPKGREASGEAAVALDAHVYRLTHDDAFIAASEELYANRGELDKYDRVLAETLHKEYMRTKNFSAEKMEENALIKNKAWQDWMSAKEADSFDLFESSLGAVLNTERERVGLWETEAPGQAEMSAYDRMLCEFEEGMSSAVLDELFGRAGERISALLKKVQASGKRIRTDFLSRTVTDAQQAQFTEYLLDTMGFDRSRGTYSISEHPFTEMLAKDDTRITTHFYPDMFVSSMYSVIHECGHALFEQLQPEESHTYFLTGGKTMGMHESVSRFYENILGRSEAFIHLVYPKMKEIFPQVLSDVTERELYEAVNFVQASLIRTEADELTYTLHIIIRYELEKELVGGSLAVKNVPARWRDMYGRYLGVAPSDDREGALQDVHWTSDFGYFPTYALGNFYNAMYLRRMCEDFDPFAAIGEGDFAKINEWMRIHVFAKADILAPAEWIRDITGRELTSDDFIGYLEKKYTDLYNA